jgi:putative protease
LPRVTATDDPSLPELLSPAGNWDCARAAVAAGADAIYFGLPHFNARLRADNFTNEDLPELMDYLHRHGVRGFVTMNTLIFTGELAAAEAQLRHIAAAGVDALIIQDLGLAEMARAIAPEVELHASTQMTITSPEGLAFVESLFPLERAVLARELSVREIERFHPARTPLEVFVHGALCVAYSGQCLTSESLGQRSANRGECAQACRMPYEIVVDGETRELGELRYLLSPQDLAAVDVIPDLVRAGVKSFKIEGRLKSPEYVTAVTRVYRKALDAAVQNISSPVTEADRYALEMTFSRGLSTGWLAGTDHPYLTHGRYGKKRGPLLGEITACGPGWIQLGNHTGVPVAAGDGVVFDAGENRDLEQGARIWKIEGGRLIFHKTYSGINFGRIKPGHMVYKTSDPKLESELRKFWQNAKPAERKTALHLIVTGGPGTPMSVAAGGASVRSPVPLDHATKRPLDTAPSSAGSAEPATSWPRSTTDCKAAATSRSRLSTKSAARSSRSWTVPALSKQQTRRPSASGTSCPSRRTRVSGIRSCRFSAAISSSSTQPSNLACGRSIATSRTHGAAGRRSPISNPASPVPATESSSPPRASSSRVKRDTSSSSSALAPTACCCATWRRSNTIKIVVIW